jgi:hypothetical protein
MKHENGSAVAEKGMYRLYLPLLTRIYCFAGPVFPLLFAVPFFLGAFDGGGPGNTPPRIVGIVPLTIGVWYAYWVFSTPHKILFNGTGQVEIISVLRRWHFAVEDIQSIKPSRSMMGFLTLRTKRGSVRLLNQFDGFHEFISRLERANHRVELRGC